MLIVYLSPVLQQITQLKQAISRIKIYATFLYVNSLCYSVMLCRVYTTVTVVISSSCHTGLTVMLKNEIVYHTC